MQLHAEFTIGLGRGRLGEPILSDKAHDIQIAIRTVLVAAFGGYTAVRGFGYWNNGTLDLHEPVLHVIVDAWKTHDEICEVACKLAVVAEQLCVHVAMREIYAMDVYADASTRKDGS